MKAKNGQVAAGEAAGASGGPGNGTPAVENVWDVDITIRHKLRRGVDINGRKIFVEFEPDVKWVKIDEETGKVLAIYVKGIASVAVHAQLLNNGEVEILGVSLDSLCQCQAGRP